MKKEDYNKLLDKFYKSKMSERVKILNEAIDVMQSYNGRSKHDCIVIAMGGEYITE